MRTRIALCAALAAAFIIATFIIAKSVDGTTHSQPRTTARSHVSIDDTTNLASLRQPIGRASSKGTSVRAVQLFEGSTVLFRQAIRSDGTSLSKPPAPAVPALSPAVARYFSALTALKNAATTPAAPPPTPAPAPAPAAAPSSGADVGAWQRVATCEEGGNNDPTYGYYGITPGSWAAYGGTQYASTAGGATQEQQVAIADRISGGAVPDANGCSGW